MIETLHKHFLPLEEIHLTESKSADEKKLVQLISSIQEKGLISPIAVNSENQLLAGYHRLLAFQRLAVADPENYSRIPVRIVNETDFRQTQQLETTEKLFRSDLSILEKAEYFKEYFDVLKYGQERHKTTTIFKTLDISRRTFFNLRAIAERLSDDIRSQLKALDKAEILNSMPQLMALCKYDDAMQTRILERFRREEMKTLFDAIRSEEKELEDESTGRKMRRKFLKSPSLKLNKDLRKELLELSRKTGKGQNELFNEIFETGLDLVQTKYS
jgi:hypothetical protein